MPGVHATPGETFVVGIESPRLEALGAEARAVCRYVSASEWMEIVRIEDTLRAIVQDPERSTAEIPPLLARGLALCVVELYAPAVTERDDATEMEERLLTALTWDELQALWNAAAGAGQHPTEGDLKNSVSPSQGPSGASGGGPPNGSPSR